MADMAAAPGAEALPEDANETLYIQNLNERVKVPVLKKSLEALFSAYGQVLSVVAHSNLRMRGQAFVSFKNKRTATKAMKEVNGFPLYGKAMRIAFARSRSDSVVLRKAGPPGSEERDKVFNAHKAQRLAHKQVSRRINPLRRREMLRHIKAAKVAAGEEFEEDEQANKSAARARQQATQLPDEYVPPNKILFLQQLPSSMTRDQLEALFGPYPGFHEVRTVPGRSDIAFIEYRDIPSGVTARESLHGYTLETGERLKVCGECDYGMLTRQVSFARA